MILDILALIILSVLCVFLFIAALHQRKARVDLLNKYVAVEIEKSVILDKLSEAFKEIQAKDVEESDGFLKFISESRDWAFQYIEEVQAALKAFDSAITPKLEYALKYGSMESNSVNKQLLLEINEEYLKLKQMLPNDMVN